MSCAIPYFRTFYAYEQSRCPGSDNVFLVFQNFQKLVERMFNIKILTMQTDWGGEYEKLYSFFQQVGLAHHVSCPHAHQQNGSAECKHHHIVQVGLALLANASMPLKFLDEASVRPGTAGLLIDIECSKVRDSSWMYLTSFVTTRLGVELAAV